MCVVAFRLGHFGGLLCFVDLLLCRTVVSSLASSLRIAHLLLVLIGVRFNVCCQYKLECYFLFYLRPFSLPLTVIFPTDVAVSTVRSGP